MHVSVRPTLQAAVKPISKFLKPASRQLLRDHLYDKLSKRLQWHISLLQLRSKNIILTNRNPQNAVNDQIQFASQCRIFGCTFSVQLFSLQTDPSFFPDEHSCCDGRPGRAVRLQVRQHLAKGRGEAGGQVQEGGQQGEEQSGGKSYQQIGEWTRNGNE